MSCDEDLGMIFLPIGTPTNDHYGGHRLGDNLFAESLEARPETLAGLSLRICGLWCGPVR